MTTFVSAQNSTGCVDTLMKSEVPTTAVTNNTYWDVGANDYGIIRPLMKFGGFPSGNFVVSSAILSMYLYTTPSVTRTLSLYPVKRNWVEGQACWNNYSTGNAWQTAGATGANDIGSVIGSQLYNTSTPTGWINITLDNALVAAWMRGEYFGITGKFDSDSPTFYMLHRAPEYATASERPYITINYASPVGVAAVYLSDYGAM